MKPPLLSRLTIAACGLALTGGTALAQDGTEVAANRTPDTAQRFLAAAPPDAFVHAKPMVREGGVQSPDVCRTILPGRAAVLNGNRYVAAPVAIVGTPSAAAPPPNAATPDSGVRKTGGLLAISYRPRKPTSIPFNAPPPPAPPPAPLPSAEASAAIEDPLTEMIIDWSTVQAVESGDAAPGPYILLRTPGDPASKDKLLYYAVAQTRDRAMAAAQFLQTACDTTKDLGF